MSHGAVVIIIVVGFCPRLNKRLHRECSFWKVIITTLKYVGISGELGVVGDDLG